MSAMRLDQSLPPRVFISNPSLPGVLRGLTTGGVEIPADSRRTTCLRRESRHNSLDLWKRSAEPLAVLHVSAVVYESVPQPLCGFPAAVDAAWCTARPTRVDSNCRLATPCVLLPADHFSLGRPTRQDPPSQIPTGQIFTGQIPFWHLFDLGFPWREAIADNDCARSGGRRRGADGWFAGAGFGAASEPAGRCGRRGRTRMASGGALPSAAHAGSRGSADRSTSLE